VTDRQKTSHFFVYSRRATHDPNHTCHGDGKTHTDLRCFICETYVVSGVSSFFRHIQTYAVSSVRPTLFHLWDLRCFRCVKFFETQCTYVILLHGMWFAQYLLVIPSLS